MELNPENPTTEALRDQWHKIMALVLNKLGVTHVHVTMTDLRALTAGPELCVVAHDRRDGLHIYLTTREEGERLARQAALDPGGKIDDVVAPAPPPPPSKLTSDPSDPRIKRGGADAEPTDQADAYLVLPPEERAKGYIRPVRDRYKHVHCGATTTMPQAIAETYARDPTFYGFTYCIQCRKHLPVAQFMWPDGTAVGS